MSAEQISSIGSGPIGAIASAIMASLIFNWQAKKWSRWIPAKIGKKGRVQLLKEQKITLRIAKGLSLAGFCMGLLCYRNGWLSDHDWRGLGLGLGLMVIFPVAGIAIANMRQGAETIKEGMVALAISEKTPAGVLIGFMALCFVAGVVSAVSLCFRP